MTTALLVLGIWCALSVATAAAWATVRTRQKRRAAAQVAARARYTAEAQDDAQARIAWQADADALCHRLAAGCLAAHDQLVAHGTCTTDCPRAWEWQLEIAAVTV